MPHVIVVDDEPAIRGLSAHWLEAAGYHPRVAADADSALAEVRSAPPGVLVTDLCMPGHNGLWLAEQVRRAYPDTAIVVATGSDDLPSAVTSLRLGVLDYLGRSHVIDATLSASMWAVLITWGWTNAGVRALWSAVERC